MTTEEAKQALPDIDFGTFILSLGTSALIHLGELADDAGQKHKPDLDLAKQTIDIIAMLKEKTEGNLDKSEEQLIGQLLYDLRTKYVDARG